MTDRHAETQTTFDPAEICTLPPPELAERRAWVRDTILRHAHATERLPDGIAWELDDVPGLVDAVDRLIELEQACCGPLRFVREPGATAARVRLEIRGVDPDAPIFDGAAPPSSVSAEARPPRVAARVIGALGLGSLASLLVCCVLPLAAAALIGGAAAPLASLDGPIPISVGALLGAALAWRYVRPSPSQP